MKKFLLLSGLIIFSLAFYSAPAQAAVDLTGVSLNINPLNASSLATWTISFTVPEDTKVGHVLISFGGYQPNLSSAELFVAGLVQGTPIVGKSNPSCVFNCDDVRYYFKDPISVKKNTKITFTLNKVKNPDKAGATGLSFINVFSSKYPQMTLAYSAGEKLVNLSETLSAPEDEPLIPATATTEEEVPVSSITKVILNQLFYQPGSKTTRFEAIKDPTKVQDLTLDVVGKEKIVFKGVMDLSKPEAINFFEKLGDYLTFDKLKLEIKQEFVDQFKLPMEITFYDLPFVWDTDLLKNETETIAKDKIADYHYIIFDNKPQLSFTLTQGGKYQLIPHFQLNIEDNQKIKSDTNKYKFTGRIADPKAVIKISLNGKELNDLIIKIDSTKGDFDFTLALLDGTNLIEAEATSEYGTMPKITKLVQYVSPTQNKVTTKEAISPFNLLAIGLALLAIIFILAILRMAKKRK